MYMKPRKLLLASSIALAFAANSGPTFANTLSQDITEARQETQIWTTYALSPYLRANDLKVSVDSGSATLTGKVDEDVSKDLAREIALGVSGINQVNNQIVVQADYVPPKRTSARGYGEVIDDATISAAVKSKLLWSKHTDGLDTDVETKLGRVTLKGTADSAESRDLAGRLAMNTRGVESVDNQMSVRTGKSDMRTAANDAGRDISDSWITTKVKSTYMYSSNVRGSDIAVSTNSGIVTLTGKVDSGAERALAIELANNIRGVKSVESRGLTL